MKFTLLLAVVGVAAVSAGCDCPQAYTALLEARSVVASGTHGHLHIPNCCKENAFINNSWTGSVAAKHTPGTSCNVISSCSTCTLMDFCKWGADDANAPPGCKDVNAIGEDFAALYSGSCSGKGDYGPAEVVDLDLDETAFQKTALKAENHPGKPEKGYSYYQQYQGNRTAAHKPSIEYGSGNFAGMFDGYLPPATCHHSNDVEPTSPGCAGYKDDGVAFVYPQFY